MKIMIENDFAYHPKNVYTERNNSLRLLVIRKYFPNKRKYLVINGAKYFYSFSFNNSGKTTIGLVKLGVDGIKSSECRPLIQEITESVVIKERLDVYLYRNLRPDGSNTLTNKELKEILFNIYKHSKTTKLWRK